MRRTGRLIVTLSGRSLAHLRREMLAARSDGADWVEIRVDRLSARARSEVSRLFPTPLPALGTLRSSAEGGEGPSDPGTRRRELVELARLPFAAIDIEQRRDLPFVRRTRTDRRGKISPHLIYSVHFRRGASVGEIRHWLSTKLPSPGVRKIVVSCRTDRCLRTFLPLLESLPEPRPALCTSGPSGQLLRAEGERLGVPFTFCGPGSERDSDPVEISQIPVDLLAGLRRGGGRQFRFGLVGAPVFRSLSPRLFHRFFTATDRTGLYSLLEVRSPSELARVVGPVFALGWDGLNVTAPLKRAAWKIAKIRGPEAVAAGCANVLYPSGPSLRAENTDVRAILRRLREIQREEGAPTRPVLVLGGGGAARATLAALRQLGWAAELEARRPGVAAGLRREFRSAVVASRKHSALAPELLIHGTTAGMRELGRLPPTWLRRVGPSTRVLDWVSSPRNSPLARRSAKVSARYEDGRRLLVYQAADAYRIWTGVSVPEPTIESSVEAICAA